MKLPRQLNAERIGKPEKEMGLISIWERMKADTYLTPYIKLNSQRITDLNAGMKTMRSTSLWPRIRQKFSYIWCQKHKSWDKGDKLNFTKIFIFKKYLSENKKTDTQKICAQYLIRLVHKVCMYVYIHIHTHILHVRFYILLLLFSC